MSNPTPVDANQLMTQLIEQVAQLTANLQKATARSSMNKPELFKGTNSAEAHCFIAQIQSVRVMLNTAKWTVRLVPSLESRVPGRSSRMERRIRSEAKRV
ncbi:hypothetical protein DFJ43DRAFT_1154545 [Lentinula guzmanii]|uniref:Uncharacterized protein n=1 Tax=Lentinula guzmanii TaxID=2804957 RepID=A0AA38N127_9AGAR|nr:hypothetical protein DFJ43DRAFT_1154545 [Lentinula guzmanii]